MGVPKSWWWKLGEIVICLILCAAAAGAVECLFQWGEQARADEKPKAFRATLYDGGQVVSSWIAHSWQYSEMTRLDTDKGPVWVRGTLIIEQVPARTEMR